MDRLGKNIIIEQSIHAMEVLDELMKEYWPNKDKKFVTIQNL